MSYGSTRNYLQKLHNDICLWTANRSVFWNYLLNRMTQPFWVANCIDLLFYNPQHQTEFGLCMIFSEALKYVLSYWFQYLYALVAYHYNQPCRCHSDTWKSLWHHPWLFCKSKNEDPCVSIFLQSFFENLGTILVALCCTPSSSFIFFFIIRCVTKFPNLRNSFSVKREIRRNHMWGCEHKRKATP